MLTPLFQLAPALCAAVAITAPAAKADADRIVMSHRNTVGFEQMLDTLAAADVVVIGEEHDHKAGHALELEILKGLQARAPSLALSLEMFERDVQLVLNEYLAGNISQASFLAASRPWPSYGTDYAPLVEFCKVNSLPVIAANAPRRYVSVVSRKGQDALLQLPRESRSYFARVPYSMDLPPGYDAALNEVFASHESEPAGPQGTAPSQPPHMKEAQGLWDATMAESILRGHHTYRKHLILSVNGAMHSDDGYGLVDRIRKSAPRLNVMIVSIKPDEAYPHVDNPKYEKVADYVILTPAAVTPPK